MQVAAAEECPYNGSVTSLPNKSNSSQESPCINKNTSLLIPKEHLDEVGHKVVEGDKHFGETYQGVYKCDGDYCSWAEG